MGTATDFKTLEKIDTGYSKEIITTFDEALAALQTYNGYFPKTALEIIISEKEKAIPHLIATIDNVIADPNLVTDDSMLHIYSLYLLAQFREKQAYQSIINILKLPGELSHDCFCATITDYAMANIIASTYNGTIQPLHEVIENPNYDEYCRAAALDSLLALYATKQIERKTVIDYFKYLFDGGLPNDNPFMWAALACNVLDIYAEELFDRVREAFKKGLVDTSVVDLTCLEQTIEDGEKETNRKHLYKHYHLIEDVIQEFAWWACFDNSDKDDDPDDFFSKNDGPDDFLSEPLQESDFDIPQPYTRSVPKVGRNDPCPCGSGKKFKKCCLN